MPRFLIGLLCALVARAAEPATLTLRRILAAGDVPPCCSSISPDAGYLAFIQNGNIVVRDLSTGDLHRVTDLGNGNPASGTPVWSSDSKQLVYTSAPRKEIIAVNVDGSGMRIIHKYMGDAVCWPKVWSSKGRILAHAQSTQKGPSSFLWIGVSDGNVQRIPIGSLIAGDVVLSPDEQQIAFTTRPMGSDTSAPTAVHLIRSDGNSEAVISSGFADEHAVGWTPNGQNVLVIRRAALWAIHILDGKVNGSAVMVQRNLGAQFHGTASITILGTTRSGALYYRIVTSTSDIYTADMDPDTGRVISEPKPLPLPRAGFNVLPRWSPDSRRILYHWVQWEPNENFVYSTETGEERRVGSDISAAAICWSVNGILIQGIGPALGVPLYEGLRQVKGFISLDPKSEQLTSFSGVVDSPVSCAGDLVAYYTDSGIRVRNLKTSSETEVYHFTTWTRPTLPSLSRDARFVAFSVRSDAASMVLVVVPSAGGPARELVKIKNSAEFQYYFGLAWSPDHQYVYFLKRPDGRSPYELFRVPANGGTEESSNLRFDNLRDIDLSPDGKRIAFSLGAVGQPEIWAMENFMAASK